MKILCVSDQIDPLVYSINIKERYQDVDLVISAGDLPMEYLEFIVSSLNKPLLFVFGNHNLNALPYYHKNLGADASLQSIAENRTEGPISASRLVEKKKYCLRVFQDVSAIIAISDNTPNGKCSCDCSRWCLVLFIINCATGGI